MSAKESDMRWYLFRKTDKTQLPRTRARSLRLPASDGDALTSPTHKAHRRRCFSSAGQQIIEYAILIAAIGAALTAMFVYGKRGLQSIIRDQTHRMIGKQVASAPYGDENSPASGDSVSETYSAGTSVANTIGIEKTYEYSDTSDTNGTAQSASDTKLQYRQLWVATGSGSGTGSSGGGPTPW